MPSWSTRARALAELSVAQAWYYRGRFALAVLGVAAAVVLVTLLAGLGHGVTTQGTQALDATNRDLWMSAPIQFAPATVGGVDDQLLDAHAVVREVRARPGVREAEAMAFQTVYVSPSGGEFTTVVGVGVTGTSAPIQLLDGPGFEQRDRHYADGTYQGPMTNAVIVDQRLATELQLGIGDALHVGGTLATAREHRFEVVGISPTFSSLIGARTVVLHLSELQTLTGSTAADPASLIAITLEPGADRTAVIEGLDRAYPAYRVRTNAEQFRSVLGRQAPVLASTVVLVAVGLSAGTALVVNILGQLAYSQRSELAAVNAVGVSPAALAGIVAMQGLGVGLAGGGLGLSLTPFIATGLNAVLHDLAGFESLIRTPAWVYLVGIAVSTVMGVLAGAVAGRQVLRLEPVEQLNGRL